MFKESKMTSSNVWFHPTDSLKPKDNQRECLIGSFSSKITLTIKQ